LSGNIGTKAKIYLKEERRVSGDALERKGEQGSGIEWWRV
jgi:hypothetical protein